MPNLFEKELGVPLPTCCNQGSCCKGASPSTPYHKLLERAVNDQDEFARGFFSIMVPYGTHAEAERVVPGIVARTLQAAQKQEAFQSPEDVVFYRCRYQTADNRCGVWEDRPQFCRDYPDTPFVVMAPGCAFEPWAKTCKEKYHAMKEEVARLKEIKQELETLRQSQASSANNASRPAGECENTPALSTADVAYGHPYTKIDDLFCASDNTDTLSLILSLTGLYVASPLNSVYFIR